MEGAKPDAGARRRARLRAPATGVVADDTRATSATSRRPAIADFAGFALSLAMVAVFGWDTRDLVWSLWLSSLVLGMATIWIGIARAKVQGPAVAVAFGKVFGFAFFAAHFGGFHFGHSQFLAMFFPLGSGTGRGVFGGDHFGLFTDYGLVFATYWPWLLAAAIAERDKLVRAWNPPPASSSFEALRKAAADGSVPRPQLSNTPFAAYTNVFRMHLLIFFFAFTAAVGLGGFFVYAVVYAVYFWPWRKR